MRRAGARAAVLGALLALAVACAGPSASARTPKPAVLASGDAAAHAALLAAAQELLGARDLRLADDALTAAPELLLERARPAGDAGRVATGRETTPPLRLRLWRVDGRCELERADTGARRIVRAACTPVRVAQE
jgi:hypothetical protein